VDDEGDWFIQIENPCRKLDAKGRCVIYEDRPLICRNYGDQCEYASDEDYGYREEFKTPEELDAYAKKTLGRKVYQREMVKARAKTDGVPKPEMRARLQARGVIGNQKKKSRS
jgi:Fe-S-cluster containining protein